MAKRVVLSQRGRKWKPHNDMQFYSLRVRGGGGFSSSFPNSLLSPSFLCTPYSNVTLQSLIWIFCRSPTVLAPADICDVRCNMLDIFRWCCVNKSACPDVTSRSIYARKHTEKGLQFLFKNIMLHFCHFLQIFKKLNFPAKNQL